jgi:leucyl-tRNA synthetase
MEEYNPSKIEKKWQDELYKSDIFQAKDRVKSPKFYVLVEFPYPSGEGLHVGHCRSYTALDVLARKRRMEGFNVLFPIGWDAFGLPTENYAIKTGVHPAIVTKKNTDNYRRQLKSLGYSFDWSREINTSEPSYYKWTQWIFVQLYKNGLAYKEKMPINWCSSCKIGLANEEVVDGLCERCGAKVERREKEQWMLKITNYADRLISDLDLVDYPERVKISQKEWIGRSEGWEIKFPIVHSQSNISVFTTRIDTLFGCTYVVLSPEHPIIEKFKNQIINYKHIRKYAEDAKAKSERERISEVKEKTGIEIKGIKAKNPANGKDISIFVADYVLSHYGAGAIMAVPAHDQRDFDFAKKYNLAIIEVIKSENGIIDLDKMAYEGEGNLVNSGKFTGMSSNTAKERIGEWLLKKELAQKKVNYKLRDWIFSRQRYWGEPMPMINCKKCGWQPVSEKDLPVILPDISDFKPTAEGGSPLKKAEDWIKTECPKCKGEAERETDVMPNWAGSNWYFLRYCDSKNDEQLAGLKNLKYWMPVDWYNGGMEHTTLHLLYSRFIYKFLYDIKAVPKEIGPEPYKKRTSHGMVLGSGGTKMSKSKGNVVNPDEVINEFGADTLRVYEMFMGPFDAAIPWDIKGVKGARRFLEKVWNLSERPKTKSQKLESLIHKTIKKVGDDIEAMKFNTAVSSLMILANNFNESPESLTKDNVKTLLLMLNPFAPFLTEEIWHKAGFKGLCCQGKWPKYIPKFIKEKKILLIIQINGRVRDKIEVGFDIKEEEAKELALNQEKIKKWIKEKEIKKIIFIPNKLINIVI